MTFKLSCDTANLPGGGQLRAIHVLKGDTDTSRKGKEHLCFTIAYDTLSRKFSALGIRETDGSHCRSDAEHVVIDPFEAMSHITRIETDLAKAAQ